MATAPMIADPETAVGRTQLGLIALRDMLESVAEGCAPSAEGLAVLLDLLARELAD